MSYIAPRTNPRLYQGASFQIPTYNAGSLNLSVVTLPTSQLPLTPPPGIQWEIQTVAILAGNLAYNWGGIYQTFALSAIITASGLPVISMQVPSLGGITPQTTSYAGASSLDIPATIMSGDSLSVTLTLTPPTIGTGPPAPITILSTTGVGVTITGVRSGTR